MTIDSSLRINNRNYETSMTIRTTKRTKKATSGDRLSAKEVSARTRTVETPISTEVSHDRKDGNGRNIVDDGNTDNNYDDNILTIAVTSMTLSTTINQLCQRQ